MRPNSPGSTGGIRSFDAGGIFTGNGVIQLMRRTYLMILVLCLGSAPALAQFGGREGDVVLYFVNAKGLPDLQVVPYDTVNTASGFETRNPLEGPWEPFGPDFEGEFFVTLHEESGDSFRMVKQLEDIVTQHNVFLGPGKVLIAEGIDRLLIPEKAPVDLTAGLFAPFPEGVDFGPEVPIFEAHSFLWTPSPFFPLIEPADPSYTSPIVPPGLTGSEYVLTLGQFLGIIPWESLRRVYPGVGWVDGIDMKRVEEDAEFGSTVRVLRLRAGRKTPPFRIDANTHIVVLSGSAQIGPINESPTTLQKFHYAFVPSGFAITISNPKKFNFAEVDGPALISEQDE